MTNFFKNAVDEQIKRMTNRAIDFSKKQSGLGLILCGNCGGIYVKPIDSVCSICRLKANIPQGKSARKYVATTNQKNKFENSLYWD